MIVTPILPEPGDPIDLQAADSRDALRLHYALPRPEWLRLNLVQSVNGSAQGSSGTSETLSNAADRSILGVIRSLATVVLIGAETLRAEDYLLPRRGRLAVVTASGELGGATAAPAGRDPMPPVLVLGPAEAEARARATLSAAEVEFVPVPGSARIDVADAIGALRDLGVASIVCEGGPSLAVQLLRAGLVDELCLTTSPQLAGGLPVLGDAPAGDLRLHGLLVDDAGALYARWLS